MSAWLRALLLLAFAVIARPAEAHKPSDSYLTLDVASASGDVEGHWDIALRDLEVALGVDANGDGNITWGELRRQSAAISDYAFARLALRADARPCTVSRGELLTDAHSDGGYAVLAFRAQCVGPIHEFGVGYRLLFDIDPSHRGLLQLGVDGAVRTAVLAPSEPAQTFDLAAASPSRAFFQFVADGVHHIWIGYDHLLFLISLLLPAVLIRRDGRWIPVGTLKSALLGVIAVVTAFTISHSITLTLAALGVVGLPSRLVESGIALSVLLAALNNVWPQVTRRAWVLAFAFGLVHGFGFASVLGDLGLPPGALALSLAGFNVGVEIGQLGVVLLVVPLIFLLRDSRAYRPAILVGGSSAIALVAVFWFVQRALGFGLG